MAGAEAGEERAPDADFAIKRADLASLMDDHSKEHLKRMGGIEGIAEALGTQLDVGNEGLPPDRVAKMREAFGENRLPEKRMKWFVEHLWESLQDLTLIILIVAAVVTIIFGLTVSQNATDWIQGVAIALAVFVVSMVTSTVNWLQDREFASLAKVKEDREVAVERGGEEVRISIFDLVVGDVFRIASGEVLPVDGVLIRGSGVTVNQSALTGEAEQLLKTPGKDPFMLGGSTVDGGSGKMLVVAVGPTSSYGRIVAALQDTEAPQTPLQKKLDKLATQIGYVGFVFGALTFIALIIAWLAAGKHLIPPEDKGGRQWYQEVLSFFVISIVIVVVAVPEGLPLAVTISLAFSMRTMAKDQNLVRKLSASETMGSATCICSDKTGTLTLNRMNTKAGVFFGRIHRDEVPPLSKLRETPDAGKPTGGPAIESTPSSASRNVGDLALAIALNSEAQIEVHDAAPPEFFDNKTECALLYMLHKDFQVDYKEIRKHTPYWEFREPFSSKRKAMTTVFKRLDRSAAYPPSVKEAAVADPGMPAEPAAYTVFTKGAAEVWVGKCKFVREADGSDTEISEERREALLSHVSGLASRGLRTLAICMSDLTEEQAVASVGEEARIDGEHDDAARDIAWGSAVREAKGVESSLTLLAIAGIKDPVRDEVPKAVEDCISAGIRVRMVTGDNALTASFIARECGILRDHPAGARGTEGAGSGEEVGRAEAAGKGAAGGAAGTGAAAGVATPGDLDLEAGGSLMSGTVPPSPTPAHAAQPTLCLEGRQYRNLSKEERLAVLPRLAVLARSIPEDKLLIVEDLKYLGEVVAVTGDGSNDAPALKAAHIGLAMGIEGTEVAREAAEITILDDNFASIVRAVKWGRSVLENIRRFLVFQLTINVVALFVTFVVACANEGDTSAFPLTPVQLIFINLIMDSFAALALATEPPSEHLLKTKPQGLDKPLMTKIMKKMIAGQAIWQTAFLLWVVFDPHNSEALFLVDQGQSEDAQRTELLTNAFSTFVWSQLWCKLTVRTIHDELNLLEDISHAKFAGLIVIIIIILQVIIVEAGGTLMSTVPLSGAQWGINIALGCLGAIPTSYIVKMIPYYDIDDELAAMFSIHRERILEEREVLRRQGKDPMASGTHPHHDPEEDVDEVKPVASPP